MSTDKITMNSTYALLSSCESYPDWIPANNTEATNKPTANSQRYNSINRYLVT
jgi:hypothetical protein